MRKESDGLGEVLVADEAYWGAQTQRRLSAYFVNDRTLNDLPCVVRALCEIKKAAALTNAEIHALDVRKSEAIIRACDEIIDGKFQGSFPVDAWVSHGTGANMNVNEVIASRANEILDGNKSSGTVHPNTHVNMCQSSNDVYPTAESIVIRRYLQGIVLSMHAIEAELSKKALAFKDSVRLGRTCMQDAVPMTFGQLFAGWQCLVTRHRKRVEMLIDSYCHVLIGATVLGTGLGVLPGFRDGIIRNLSKVLGYAVQRSYFADEVVADSALFDGSQNCDETMILMGSLKGAVGAIARISNDLMLFASGPVTGFNEFFLPPAEKFDGPLMTEFMQRVKAQVATTETLAMFATANDDLDLAVTSGETFMQVIESLELTQIAFNWFVGFVSGLNVNCELAEKNAELSTSLATMPSSLFGYQIGTRIAHLAYAEGISCKEACLRESLLSKEIADDVFNLLKLTDVHETERMFEKYHDIRTVQ